jgi:hypothetical protein
MGMSCIGKNPTNEAGKYFRSSVWYWGPLAGYVRIIAPEIAAKCKYWDTNDGDGLNAVNSLALANKLQAELDSGKTAEFKQRYESNVARIPKEPCEICAGTGTRKPIPQTGAGDPRNGGIKCNGCGGEGCRESWMAKYPFDIEHIQRFASFLRGCGGFQIY